MLTEFRDVQDALSEINETIIRKNNELSNDDDDVLATQKKVFAYYQNALNNMKTLIGGGEIMYKQEYYDNCMKKIQEIEDANKALDDVKNNTKMLQEALNKLIEGDY
jgi:hypothetical protein